MKMLDILLRSGRNLRSAKLRTVLTAIAIGIGGFTLTATLAASQGARNYTDKLVSSNFDPSSLIVAKDKSLFGGSGPVASGPQEYDPTITSLGGGGGVVVKRLTTSDLDKISKLKDVAYVLPNYQLNAQYVTRADAKKYTARLQVYDPAQKPTLKAGTAPSKLADGSAMMPEAYISLLGFSSAESAIGQQVTVQIQQITGKVKAQTFTIVGITTQPVSAISFDASTIYVSDNDARSADEFVNNSTINEGEYLAATVHVQNGKDQKVLESVKAAIEAQGFVAQSVKDTQAFINQIINVLQTIILVFGAVTVVASFFGVVNTQYISVLERTREIGLMKALGMGRGSVSWLFMIEATWIGFLGSALGAAGAVVVGNLMNPWISKKLNFGEDSLLVFQPIQIAMLVAFLMLITTLAGVLPARKAAKLDPIEALRTE